jgi:hypothetical protein
MAFVADQAAQAIRRQQLGMSIYPCDYCIAKYYSNNPQVRIVEEHAIV